MEENSCHRAKSLGQNLTPRIRNLVAFGFLAPLFLLSSPASGHHPMYSDVTIVDAYSQTEPTVVDEKPELVRTLYFNRFGAHVENGDGSPDDQHNLYHAIYKATPNFAGFDWSAPDGQKTKLVAVPTCDVYVTGSTIGPNPISRLEYRDKFRTWTSKAGTTLDAVYVTGTGANVIFEKADGTRLFVDSASLIDADQKLINTTYAPWVFIREDDDAPPDPIMIDPAIYRFQFADGKTNSVKERNAWERHNSVTMVGDEGNKSEIPQGMVMVSDFETEYHIPAAGYLLNYEIYNFVESSWVNVRDTFSAESLVVKLGGGQKGFRAKAYDFDYKYQLGEKLSRDDFLQGKTFKFRTSIWDRANTTDDLGRNNIVSSPNVNGISAQIDAHGAHFRTTRFMMRYGSPY